MNRVNVGIIENFMREKGINKTEFCKLCGISTRVLCKIYANKISVNVKILFRIARVLNIGIYELII